MTTNTDKSRTDALTIQRDMLNDLIDDVRSFADQIPCKPHEKAWRADLIARARTLAASPVEQPAPVPADERAAWFSVAMNATASLSDAANWLTDPNSKRITDGSAAFARKRANELWQARAAAAQAGATLTDEQHVFALAAKHDGFGDRKHFDFTGAELLEFARALLASHPTNQPEPRDEVTDKRMDVPAGSIQWWLADLDRYGNPKLSDGSHSGCAGADKAAYLHDRLGLKRDRVFAVARVELFEPRPSSDGVNDEAAVTCRAMVDATRAGESR